MTMLKMVGFEDGTVDALDMNDFYDVTASTTQKRTGAYSGYVGGTNTRARFVLIPAPTEIYGQFGFWFTEASSWEDTADKGVLGFSDSAGIHHMTVELRYLLADRFMLYRFDAAGAFTLLASGGMGTLFPDRWHCVEYRVKVDAVNGVVEVRIDGVQAFIFNGNTVGDGAAADIGVIRLPAGASGAQGATVTSSFVGYMDDIIINDTAGAINNTWPGRGGVWMVKPEGVGTVNTMTASAGANWEAVNEIPSTADTDYVQSRVLADKDSYAMTALTPTVCTAAAVKWLCRARLVYPGTGGLKYLMRQAGVDYNGADQVLDVSYRLVSEILETAPSGAAWTKAIIDAIEAGQEVV